MLARFQAYIEKNQLFGAQSKILLAISGGVDSMVLLHLLNQGGHQIALAHCNFGLRANASDADQAFIRDRAAENKIPFHDIKFDTKSYASDQGISTQEAARELRYQWFGKICEEYGYDVIATAHHASDQVETVLFNLTKGCSISGLHGIPVRNNRIVRPLLFLSKDEILTFARENQLTWREDESNATSAYSRNFIRHDVIPNLKRINPALESTMLRNIERFKGAEQLLLEECERIKKEHMKAVDDYEVLILDWMENTSAALAILDHILRPYGFNYHQVTDIASAPDRQRGAVYLSENYELISDNNQLIISQAKPSENTCLYIEETTTSITIDGSEWHFEIIPISRFKMNPNKHIASLDFDKLQFPLKVRNWAHGDKFYPLGMSAQKKLSDFMIDEKIPLNLKRRLLLLESDQKIAWVVGHRIDNRFKITDDTQKVLQITKTDPDD